MANIYRLCPFDIIVNLIYLDLDNIMNIRHYFLSKNNWLLDKVTVSQWK